MKFSKEFRQEDSGRKVTTKVAPASAGLITFKAKLRALLSISVRILVIIFFCISLFILLMKGGVSISWWIDFDYETFLTAPYLDLFRTKYQFSVMFVTLGSLLLSIYLFENSMKDKENYGKQEDSANLWFKKQQNSLKKDGEKLCALVQKVKLDN